MITGFLRTRSCLHNYCSCPLRQPTRLLIPVALALVLLLSWFSGAANAALSPGVPLYEQQWAVTGVAPWAAPDLQFADQLLVDLGAEYFRPIVTWSEVQPNGPEEWDWTHYDNVFNRYRAEGAKAWVMLNSGSAEWATDTSWLESDPEKIPATDCPPRVLPALASPITGAEPYYIFVYELVRRYGDVVSLWLIDNEPSELWSWAGDGYSYACMVRLAAAAIHDADPNAVVVLGAIPAGTLSNMVIADRMNDPSQQTFVVSYATKMWGRRVTMNTIRFTFTDPAFRMWDRVNFYRQALAVLNDVDALAGNVGGLHARNNLAADNVWSYMDQMTTHGGTLRPLVYTEINPLLVDPLAQAQATTQLMLGSLASGMMLGQAYFQFIDGGVPDFPQPNTGLVTSSLTPKTPYYAYRTLISYLGSAAVAGSMNLSAPFTGYWFQTREGVTIYALWASRKTTVNLSKLIGAGRFTVIDMTGKSSLCDSRRIPASASPVYIFR